MRWSPKGYAFGIVDRGGQSIRGWPWYARIPFANLSSIPGGQGPLRLLLAMWDVGILRFEDASDEERELAKRNPAAVLPGEPPVLPAPLCWGPFGTNQMGMQTGRGRYRHTYHHEDPPTRVPVRRVKRGPKTPKLILDSDVEDVELDSSDDLM